MLPENKPPKSPSKKRYYYYYYSDFGQGTQLTPKIKSTLKES